MKRLIDKTLSDDIIEPSSSAWAAPVVMIPKKTGVDPRFCVDIRKLNSVTLDDAYPLPTIQEIMDSLSGAKIFTTLDLNSGYWQVNMDAESREKTAFICAFGLYQFKVMPCLQQPSNDLWSWHSVSSEEGSALCTLTT